MTEIESTIRRLLLEALEGTTYNLENLRTMSTNTPFSQAGIDSLDLTDFMLRVQDRYSLSIPQEEVAHLKDLDTVARYIASHAVN